MRLYHFIFLLLSALFTTVFITGSHAMPKFNPADYSVVIDAKAVNVSANISADSMLRSHPMAAQKNIINGIEHVHARVNKTMDFYLLLTMFFILGLVRYTNPRYFGNLWRAFWNATLSGRQLKDQLEGDSMMSLLMNIFFTIVAGTYMYYVAQLIVPHRTGNIAPALLLAMMIGGMIVIYTMKYLMVRFSGWAFNIESITENYIFNIFLVNKITAVVLLPVVVFLAFAGPVLAGPTIIVSLVVIVLMLVNRYVRSWQVFGSFFQYSKFHFFTYLCASELLPLAVLMKLLVRGLVY